MVKEKPLLILLAEDEPAHAEAILLAFQYADPRIVVQVAGTLGEYRRTAADHPPDIAILDLSLPDGRAVEVLTWPPEAGPFPIMIMTSFGNERTAVEAMKAGALDYIVKSPEAFDELPRAVERALREWNLLQERKRAEDALRRAEENFRRSLDDSPLGVRIVNAEGETLYANRAILDIYGYDSIEELRATPLGDRYTPESYGEFQLRKEKRLQGEVGPPEYQISIVKKNGEIRRLQVFRKEVFWNGTRRFQTLYHDVTEQKRAEEAVQAALREKEVLLREIHHRVKNNMQVISSLFNLQAGHIKDEEARRILKEGQTRIRSMGLIHEKLYQSRDLSKIDFSAYIRSLSVHLFHAYRIDANQVRLETELEDVHLDINAAVPCGLLVNELISNALKHAFPEGRKGVVKIGLRRREDGAVELRVADDGVGFPETLDFQRTESLGLQIANLLIGQLDGSIELERKRGTAIVIAFQESGHKSKTA
jgi:PAS domain S-box-containing protein